MYGVNQIVITWWVITLCDVSKFACGLGYVLCEPFHAARMLFNLSIS